MVRDLFTLDAGYWEGIQKIIQPAIGDTLYMIFFASFFACIIGIFLGIILFVTSPGNLYQNTVINTVLGNIVNIIRSVPFVIVIIAAFPLSRLIVGRALGVSAAIVPLTIAAAPFVARLIETSLRDLDWGVIEAAISMGASEWQIIIKVMLPEAASSIISGVTVTIINIVGYSAIAGTIGAGGLGDVAVKWGYQMYRNDLLVLSIILMVILVQVIQMIGNKIASILDKR